MNLISNINLKQKGVVFGIDARIGIVIVAIASMALALNRLAVTESKRLQNASYNILKIAELTQDYYKEYNTDLSELKTLYSQSAAVQNNFWKGLDSLKYDPWGNQWKFLVSNADITLSGQTVNAKCVVVISNGGDGYGHLYSVGSGQSYVNCLNNTNISNSGLVDTQMHDDLFYKFTTVEIEHNRLEKLENQLEKIKSALLNYQSAKLNKEVDYCNNLDIETATADSRCSYDSTGDYNVEELKQVNHLPKSSLDTNSAVYYSNATVYTNKNLEAMQNLMTHLGLPISYAQDGFKRILSYNSNYTNSTTGPFYAEIFYE